MVMGKPPKACIGIWSLAHLAAAPHKTIPIVEDMPGVAATSGGTASAINHKGYMVALARSLVGTCCLDELERPKTNIEVEGHPKEPTSKSQELTFNWSS